jgi:hypothetical protein
MESRATRKYFEHAGALLTADGSGDDLIKLEGVPRGESFTWDDDVLDEPIAAPELELEPEPDDICPARIDTVSHEASEGDDNDAIIDDEDDPDDDDAPPAPKEAPAGFCFATDVPTDAQLAFSKEPSPADELVGSSILYNWPVVGWCVGTITKRNFDARVSKKIDGQMEKVNFFIYYEIDGDEVKTVLRSSDYGGEGDGAWVLLEAK